MEYKRFGSKIIVRIDKDEEILEKVKGACAEGKHPSRRRSGTGGYQQLYGGRIQCGGKEILRQHLQRQL